MSFRFRRRIRVAPGLSLNVGKRSVSVSAGVRGASMTLGKHGLYRNLGLTGSGLSHRQRIGAPAAGSAKKRRERQPKTLRPEQLQLRVDDQGRLQVCDLHGHALPSGLAHSLLRQHRNWVRERLKAHCAQRNANVAAIAQLHHATPAPRQKPRYIAREFLSSPPDLTPRRSANLLTRLWPAAGRRLEAENRRAQAANETALAAWRRQREAHEAAERERRQRHEVSVFEAIESMAEVIVEGLQGIDWPCATDIDFDLGDDKATIAIDIDLPPDEKLPAVVWHVHGSQYRLRQSPLGVLQRRKLYRDYVHSAALRVLGEIFASLPTVQRALVSGYTQVADAATGHQVDRYLYSVIVQRSDWLCINFDNLQQLDPALALKAFQLRRKMTKTGIFHAVTPFTTNDLAGAGLRV